MTNDRIQRLENQMDEMLPSVARNEERLNAMSTVIEELKDSQIETNSKLTQAVEVMTQCNAAQDVRHEKVTGQVSSVVRILKWMLGIATAVLTAYLVSLVS